MSKKVESIIIEAYKFNKQILKDMRTARYRFINTEELCRLDNAIDVAIKSMSKQIPFAIKDKDEENLTGICKCGRVTGKVSGEFYCKYCGQRVFW